MEKEKEKTTTELTGFELRPQNSQVKLALRYIEDHIDEDISLQELTNICGYSYHRFCHLFKIGTGFSPKNYIILRKLHRASLMLSDGMPLNEVVEKSGYGTATDKFCRAFKKHFGVSATKYIKQLNSQKITPEFVRLGAKTVVGYRFDATFQTGHNKANHCAYWQFQRFDEKLNDAYNSFSPAFNGECAFWTVPAKSGEKPFYIYGTPVSDVPEVPDGLTAVKVPEAEYAIFPVDAALAFYDMCDNLRKTHEYVTTQWLPSSDCYIDSRAPILECYHGTDVALCFPIRRFN